MIPDAGAGRDEVPNVYGAATASPGLVLNPLTATTQVPSGKGATPRITCRSGHLFPMPAPAPE